MSNLPFFGIACNLKHVKNDCSWIVHSVQAMVSLRRIDKFMNNEELDDGMIEHQKSETKAVVIENGSFCWGKNEPIVLEDVNIEIKKGSLTAVRYKAFHLFAWISLTMRSDEKIDLHSFLNTHCATLILCYGIFVGKIPRNRAIKYFFLLNSISIKSFNMSKSLLNLENETIKP